jgi:uracil-DNA glycosylase
MVGLIGNDWEIKLKTVLQSEYFTQLGNKIGTLRESRTIYPKREDVFRCFKLTPFDSVKVVILGQDPYYTPNTANGLAFATSNGYVPPSLQNIIQELYNEYDKEYDKRFDSSLENWAKQGVLLLNTALTVELNCPEIHASLWRPFTEEVLKKLSEYNTGVIYLLWGNHAKSFKNCINNNTNYILEAVHPSPLSAHRGWYGNDHFKKVNEIILKNNGEEFIIDWFK